MRHLLLAVGFLLIFASSGEVGATGFSNPLAEMTVLQNFGGSGGTHIGTDLDGNAGDPIYALADGKVCYYDGSASAYGGGVGECARDGIVLFVRYRKANGDYFVAHYGHIQNVPSALREATQYTVNGPNVSQGQKIGEIGVYTPKRDCSPGRADHLHFGIWDSDNQFPSNHWGYNPTPCWTTPEGCWVNPMTFLANEGPYSSPYASQFAAVYDRNGGYSTMGNSTSGIYAYGPYLRQNYAGGSFGNCCILYDPNNGMGNPQATNEAYLLRTGFYDFYMVHGWEAYGCPTRDEYHPETGAPYDAIQFFVRRVEGATQFHYMYYQHQGNVFSWHSVYATQWAEQDPGGKVGMLQGATRTFTVRFKNTGTTTWHNNPTTYPYDYVTLKSTDPDGNVASSLLYASGLGWLDAETPCTMVESAVAPGDTATFTFTGKVASGQSPGLALVYFRPCHSMAELLPGWDGMHYQVQVIAPLVANAYADVAVLYNYGSCQTRVHMLLSASDTLIYQGDNGWRVLNDYCLQYVIRSLAGDFDGNGVQDVATVYQYGACQVGIHVLLSTGVAFDYSPYWWESDGYCVSQIHGMAAGDFNADGKDDIATLYDYGSCDSRLHVLLSTGASFLSSPAEGWWRGNGWYCASGVKFMAAGDITGDGKDDVVLAYRYGASNTSFHTFLSTGSSFTYQSTWWSADYYSLDAVKFLEMGDFNADGKADIVTAYRYGASNTALHVFLSQGSSFWYQGAWWQVDYYSLDAVPYMQVGDITGEGRADVAMAYRYGEYNSAIHSFISSGTAFTYQPFWWQHTAYGWDFTNTFLVAKFDWNGGSPKVLADDPNGPLPQTFALSQNYPNPFNPVTTIAYSLPAATHVTLDVFNILGQKVATLVDEPQTTGDHQVTWDATQHSSGVYLYRITTADAVETKKMLLLK